MIKRRGPREWENVHVTKKTQLADLIDLDNSRPPGMEQPTGFSLLQQAAHEFDTIIQDARQQGKRVRALGSGWALTDIAITDGYLINTKQLNGCYDVADRYFHPDYDSARRPFVTFSQCGMSIGELNVYLEVENPDFKRALKTAGIGAGQTVVGAVSGNTHGAGIRYGSTPDFVLGLQLVTGTGQSLWIERASRPVLNEAFCNRLGSVILRDDDVFDAAVMSFGAFGIISAVAIETDPMYHLKFQPVREIHHDVLKARLGDLAGMDRDDPQTPYHYEFVFDPYDDDKFAMEASALKVAFEPGHPDPKPMWIVRDEQGFAPADDLPRALLDTPLASSKLKTQIQFKEYRKRAILDDVRGTPGQLFTATITYFEGYTESAIAVSIDDAGKMIDISSEVIKRLDIPSIAQVRVVHPSDALLAFTRHGPKTAVFEWALSNDARFAEFEKTLTDELKAANVAYTFHWSKNSGIDHEALLHMYGADRVDRWGAARRRVFNDDAALMKVFDNAHLERAGLT